MTRDRKPRRRKSKAELAGTDQSEAEEQSDSGSEGLPFEALTDEEHEEFNALFTLLNSNGYQTIADYSLTHTQQHDHKIVTLTAILPSTNEWDPSIAYEPTDQEADNG